MGCHEGQAGLILVQAELLLQRAEIRWIQLHLHFLLSLLLIGSIVAWLASEDSGFTTGADFSCNGGLHMG